MKNAIGLFEIPVKIFERAKKFYETILGAEGTVMPATPDNPMKYGMLPFDQENGGVGGGVIEYNG